MEIGQRIKTGLGEVLVLDIQDKYLILFDDIGKKFVKANGYDKDSQGKIFWQGGEYYNSFTELVETLER